MRLVSAIIATWLAGAGCNDYRAENASTRSGVDSNQSRDGADLNDHGESSQSQSALGNSSNSISVGPYNEAALLPNYALVNGAAKSYNIFGWGQCDENQGVIAINDGDLAGITCAPFVGQQILSTNPSKQYMKRDKICGEDEVMVGRKSFKVLLCTALDPRYKLSTVVGSIYRDLLETTTLASISDVQRSLLSQQNHEDACLCPNERQVFIGSSLAHSFKNNVCVETCSSVEVR